MSHLVVVPQGHLRLYRFCPPAFLISSVRKEKYVLWESGDSGIPINLLNGVPQGNRIAPRRLRALAARVLGKFCLVYRQEKFTLLL